MTLEYPQVVIASLWVQNPSLLWTHVCAIAHLGNFLLSALYYADIYCFYIDRLFYSLGRDRVNAL